jgi:hypothetical protein
MNSARSNQVLLWVIEQVRYQGNTRILFVITYLPTGVGERIQW